MGRPFRLQPPALVPTVVARPALLATLAERWDRRLVTVVGGPGFGKTTLLVEAMSAAERGSSPGGVDVWLGCEPADRDRDHLLGGLAEAVGTDPEGGIAGVCASVWARAPTEICLVLDDVHEVPEGSDSATLLTQLLDELPANGHVVLASRDPVPVATARLAAAGRLARVREPDLVLDADEMEAFARTRGVPAELVASSGGWPALAELVASVGADMVAEYLWEEVLAQIGSDRADLVARLAVVGGGDDALASALAGAPRRVEDVVGRVPLVLRSEDGWVVPHALWEPAARALLAPDEVDEARRVAADAHRAAGRMGLALDLLVEAADWDGFVAVLREAALLRHLPAKIMGRWTALPEDRRGEPIALLAAAIEARDLGEDDAIDLFVRARAALRDAGDVEGEIAVLIQESLARWWIGDMAGLLELVARTSELAAAGHPSAQMLDALARAAAGHVLGDSAAVFAALAEIDGELPVGWQVQAAWLQSVAHRRDGDLGEALAVLDRIAPAIRALPDHQHDVARARIRWLAGDVAGVPGELDRLARVYEGTDTYLFAEATLEAAAKRALLGDAEGARRGLAAARAADDVSSVVTRFLALVTEVALLVDRGDEDGAAALLRAAPEAAPGRHDSWYWRDRCVLGLPYLLLPDQRDGWDDEPRGVVHQPGHDLAVALVAARGGDLGAVRALAWPDPAIVRIHLPLAWVVELAAWCAAADNPPPDDLLRALGSDGRHRLASLVAGPSGALARGAAGLVTRAPATPSAVVRVEVLGPLVVRRDGVVDAHPHLRRARVRQLLTVLAVRPRIRRDEIADLLWPEHDDPARNVRTTLSYLRQVLEPLREATSAPFLLRSEGAWLVLDVGGHLETDLRDLDAGLGAAAAAEQRGAPADALERYLEIVPLWRGTPLPDVDASWCHQERASLQARYVAATVRAGELLLAAGDPVGARAAAEHAVGADPASAPAHRLAVAVEVAAGDPAAAARAEAAYALALADLGLPPDPEARESGSRWRPVPASTARGHPLR